jgi:putative ABC transport system permease protein
MKVGISMSSIFIAFTFSAVIGIFFGFYPAKSAAALKQVEALRNE